MVDSNHPLAILRWRHIDNGIEVSWPLLHPLSMYARGGILCTLIIAPLAIGAISFVQDKSIRDVVVTLGSQPPPWTITAVVAIPWSIFVLDFLLRFRMVITREHVVLSKPWGAKRTWKRSDLTFVQFDEYTTHTSRQSTLRMGNIELAFESGDGRERVAIGGSMSVEVAKQLSQQLEPYAQVRGGS